jgi:hypothetical protein
MALVNPNIAMSFRAPEIQQQNMLADYAAMQQIQSGRQAQEMNALKMQEAQAAMQERNALRQLNPAAADYESQLFRVNPTLGIAYRKERSAADASAAQIAASQAAAAKSGFDLKAAQRKFVDDLKRGLSSNPSDANIIAFGEDAVLQGLYTPEQVKGTVDQLLALPAADRVRILSQAGATAGELRPVAVGGSLMTPQGQLLATAPRQPQLLTPEEEAQKARIALAGRPPPQPRAESPLVAIVGPDGSPILVSRESAVGKTPANVVEKPMTQAQKVKYTKDKVSDKDVVTGAFAVTGELEKLTDELVGNPDKKIAPAPGLSSITGFSALTNPLALPSGDARKALQKLETFKGKIMALGRQLASQEGKLGNMAVQEWKFVSDAVQKIDPAAGNLDVQMRDVVRQAREYSQRQQSKYDDTYADDLTAPAKSTLSPIDKQALEWANSNSADPRAAAIKQRLGK